MPLPVLSSGLAHFIFYSYINFFISRPTTLCSLCKSPLWDLGPSLVQVEPISLAQVPSAPEEFSIVQETESISLAPAPQLLIPIDKIS